MFPGSAGGFFPTKGGRWGSALGMGQGHGVGWEVWVRLGPWELTTEKESVNSSVLMNVEQGLTWPSKALK